MASSVTAPAAATAPTIKVRLVVMAISSQIVWFGGFVMSGFIQIGITVPEIQEDLHRQRT